MRKILKIIARDFFGLIRVCGFVVAFKWLWAVFTHLGECKRSGNLQPADRALGDGPFKLRLGKSRATVLATQALTGIREIWVRDCYLHQFLKIDPAGVVVDLGCNCGLFTALALGHGPAVRVIAVEGDPLECDRFRRSLAASDWLGRVQLLNGFVGGHNEMVAEIRGKNQNSTLAWIVEDDLMQLVGDSRINFLKCDIEGSEFQLFSGSSRLLDAADQIAIEVHPHAGDPQEFIERLKFAGFEIQISEYPPTIVVRGRRMKLRG